MAPLPLGLSNVMPSEAVSTDLVKLLPVNPAFCNPDLAYGQQCTQEVAARFAAGFAAAARLHRLRTEVKLLRAQERELAIQRVQRWSRLVRWRRKVLPVRLLRARIVYQSCILIQRTWRALVRSSCNRSVPSSRRTYTSDATITGLRKGRRDQGFNGWHPNKAIHDAKHRIRAFGAESDAKNEPRCFSSPSRLHGAADAGDFADSGASKRPGAIHSVIPKGISEVDLGLSLGPGGRRAAAMWRGYRVRRAFEHRDLQAKIRLRHDLYILISDVEGRSHGCTGQAFRRLTPWVDTLYTELRRLQGEVLQEFADVFNGKVQRWGYARSAVKWRGWPRDLQRLSGLSIQGHDRSSLSHEPSLLASTTLQIWSPPNSPTLPCSQRGARLDDDQQHEELFLVAQAAARSNVPPEFLAGLEEEAARLEKQV